MSGRKIARSFLEKIFLFFWTLGIAAAVWVGITSVHYSLVGGNPIFLLPGVSLLLFAVSTIYREFRIALQKEKKSR